MISPFDRPKRGRFASMTLVLGVILSFASAWIESRAAMWAGLDIRVSAVGLKPALLYLFAFVAPLQETLKVASSWPSFRSRHFRDELDGMLYAGSAALGFALVESIVHIRTHGAVAIWLARIALAFPAHLFFAGVWGYALGRARRQRRPGIVFPVTWLACVAAHGAYIHFIYARDSAALSWTVPVALMLIVASGLSIRSILAARGSTTSSITSSSRPSRIARFATSLRPPKSLREVRESLLRGDQPVRLRWVLFGALVTFGGMILGFVSAVAFALWAQIDFSTVNENDLRTMGPVILMSAIVLLSFPISGFILSRAASALSLREPIFAIALAIVLTVIGLGMSDPLALVFAVVGAPVALAFACAGAWVGRPLG